MKKVTFANIEFAVVEISPGYTQLRPIRADDGGWLVDILNKMEPPPEKKKKG